MNRARWKEIDEQFRQAIDLPATARIRFVRELQVRNPELGFAVKDLLESAAEAEAVLGESAAVFAGPMLAGLSEEEWDALHPGALVGGYRLLREIGRGSRSTVYLAEPADAKFGTRIAIKVLTRGIDTSDVIARIVHERGTLVALSHPGIARFHDGGATAGGLPYFIIELVDGRPVLAWCDERRLDVTTRLGVFLQACAAVQYAHQHFVAHSDLTPSRILVSDRGDAKIMEFGTARLLHAGPVTTADDVESLGVLLHQLLTGRTPPSAGASASEVARAGGEPVSRARSATPATLAAALRGDLDAIVARALEEDPLRRYQSAAALADDIIRHMKLRPVHARPATTGYRAGRFVLRHRARLGIAALALLAVMSMAGTTGVRLSRWDGASEGAVTPVVIVPPTAERTSMASAPPVSIPNALAHDAEGPAAPAPAVPVVAAPAPPQVPTITSRVKQPPEPTIETRGLGQLRRSPADSAAMLSQLAATLRKAKRNTDAEAALRQAVSLSETGSLAEAERLWELGDVLRVMHRYEEAERLLRSSLLLRKRMATSDGAEVGQSLAGLAMVQCEQGRSGESDSLFKQAIAIYRRLPTDAGGLRMPETDRAQCR